MRILGINANHHPSVCVVEDGELKYFIESERIGKRTKYGDTPFVPLIDILLNIEIDHIAWGSPSLIYPYSINLFPEPFKYRPGNNIFGILHQEFQNRFSISDYSNNHHKTHAAHAFYNSGFKKAIGVVIDGMGSRYRDENKKYIGTETETIFECSYPCTFKVLNQNLLDVFKDFNISRLYEMVTEHLGWGINEAGKTMGLAPYGKKIKNIPHFFKNKIANKELYYTRKTTPGKHYFHFSEKYPELIPKNISKEWHYDKSKITDLEKDFAYKIQDDTQQVVGDYIEEAIKKTGLKQVCCAGGYFLNCVTNYYLKKRFPDIEFYFEPVANDAGTAIGAAKLFWHEKTQDKTIRPFKSLYLGKKYYKEELLEKINEYVAI